MTLTDAACQRVHAMTDATKGGWRLTLTCTCGTVEEFRAVVAGLVLQRAERAGWTVPSGRQARPVAAADGTCGCWTTGAVA